MGVVATAVVLPLTANAGQVGDSAETAGKDAPAIFHAPGRNGGAVGRDGDAAGRDGGAAGGNGDAAGRGGALGEGGTAGEGGAAGRGGAGKPSAAPSRSPLVLGLGLATAARCGPELSSPDGIEAQTCVLTQGEDTWARTYYRNTSGDALEAVLSLMGPAGRTVQTRCVTGTDDEPATCETPRERTRGTQGAPGDYTAVTEFSARGTDGPLLLRSGSNSRETAGS
ncbi:hypothetical protein OIB37_18690 [Streptomyces sp. NBC_00820]|uniref:hypothetical protein n=1 Tax=Streptomyces sp. NBC_00820 TaxID=2975842 RepID=UPI002ED13F15|nr:hypothetical protein OIB37_18690 [Streptomyces sp. NBC_00820]